MVLYTIKNEKSNTKQESKHPFNIEAVTTADDGCSFHRRITD